MSNKDEERIPCGYDWRLKNLVHSHHLCDLDIDHIGLHICCVCGESSSG